MKIASIFSFLVYPSKNMEIQPDIGGTEIPLKGNLYDMLHSSFATADRDCNIDIAFKHDPHGNQFNPCRKDIIDLISHIDIGHARVLAQELQAVTTRRSGLGLFFVIVGKNNLKDRIYISRFPTDFGIVAEERANGLNVQLLEQVFMKSAISYKAAIFEGKSPHSDFWRGKATDKQVGNKNITISGYWIKEFLKADFLTTSELGTRRLAKAIKMTMDATNDIEIKEELYAASLLAKSLNGSVISMDNFADRFCLSQKAYDAMAGTLQNPALQFQQFEFSSSEFSKLLKIRSLHIDNGAILTAPIGQFDKCFKKTPQPEQIGEYVFSTKGRVVDDELRMKS